MKVQYLYQRKGVYWFQGPSRAGVRPKPVSLGTRDPQLALEMRQILLAEGPEPVAKGSLAGAVERFLRERSAEGRHTAKTASNYASVLGLFCGFAGARSLVSGVDAEMVNGWKAALLESGCKRSTVTNYLTHLRAFLNWAKMVGLLARMPIDGKRVTVPGSRATRAAEFYSRAQRDALLANAARLGLADLEWVLMLGFHAGMRYREIVEARGGWFVREGDRWRIEVQGSKDYGLKWHKARTVPCNRTLGSFLEDRCPGGDGFVVAPKVGRGKGAGRWDARKQWFRCHVGLVVPGYSFHAMRHTFASLHVGSGTSMALVAQWLGVHVGVAFTHYAKYADGGGAVDNVC